MHLTHIMGKIFEKIIRTLLNFELTGKLDPHQYAFRNNHSCEGAVAKIIHQAQVNSEKASFRVLAIDFSKAFDKVHHHTLTEKPMYFPAIYRKLCTGILSVPFRFPVKSKVVKLPQSGILNCFM